MSIKSPYREVGTSASKVLGYERKKTPAKRQPPEMITLTCAACGTQFDKPLSEYNYKRSILQTRFYCSPDCGRKKPANWCISRRDKHPQDCQCNNCELLRSCGTALKPGKAPGVTGEKTGGHWG